MTRLEEAQNLTWYWHKKPIKLKNLDPRQLESIKKTLQGSKSNWFSRTPSYWLNAIKLVEKRIDKQSTNEAIGLIKDQRIKNAELKANYLTNKIITCFKK